MSNRYPEQHYQSSSTTYQQILAIESNNRVFDKNNEHTIGASFRDLTWDDDKGKLIFWHTSAHILAYALKELYPGIKLGTGPAIENGFYYDVDFGDYSFTEKDFITVEKKMIQLSEQGFENIRINVSKDEALRFFLEKNDPYKLEIIDGLKDGFITF